MILQLRARTGTTPLLLASLLAFSACAKDRGFGGEFARLEPLPEASAPLGGDALIQQKRDLRRAQGDMVRFHATLESLHQRRDSNGLVLFSQFLDAYMGLYLDPLLRSEWQSRHPELAAFDANLRLVKAEVLVQLRSPRRVEKTLQEIERRYTGREDMLVDYPIGKRGTLGEGMEILRKRKWRG